MLSVGLFVTKVGELSSLAANAGCDPHRPKHLKLPLAMLHIARDPVVPSQKVIGDTLIVGFEGPSTTF